MGRKPKVKYPISWHEECLRNSEAHKNNLQLQVENMLSTIAKIEERNRKLAQRIQKAKEEGVLELPVMDE